MVTNVKKHIDTRSAVRIDTDTYRKFKIVALSRNERPSTEIHNFMNLYVKKHGKTIGKKLLSMSK